MKAVYRIASCIMVGVFTAAGSISAYDIGFRTLTFTDPVRSRDIPVYIAYPAESPGSSAPVAAGVFPVIVFGHGFLIDTDDYGFLWEAAVPEGFIVILPSTEGTLSPDHGSFGLDLAFLCDFFPSLNTDPASPFYQHVAPATAVMGHSMGGGSSFLAAAETGTITALANFAAAETDPSAIGAAEAITIPALLFAATEDCITPPNSHQMPMYTALSSECKTIVTLNGASHCQFASNNSTCRLGEIISGCSASIPLETQETRTLSILIPWLQAVLMNNPTAWTSFQQTLQDGITSGIFTVEQQCPTPPLPTPTPTPASSPTPACINSGDATLDGTLTAGDAQLIFSIVLGSITPTFEEACAADCTGDGSITAGDAQQTFFAVLGTGTCTDPIVFTDYR
ncbi:hypothetical protein JXA80_14785 [bacterium]|nr:hypothetical protein [candidate division CSSED10-310 bacterium]